MELTFNPQNISPEETQSGETKKEILDLFSVTDSSLLKVRNETDRRVSEVINEFIGGSEVSTDVRLNDLLTNFCKSEIPDKPLNVDEYIAFFNKNIIRHSTRTSSPRYIGHMTSALPYFIKPLAGLIVTLNQNVVKAETAKVLTPYERQVIAMLHRAIYQFDSDFYNHHIQNRESVLGILTSGGTIANLTALWCARNSALGPCEGFNGVEKEGMDAALKFYGYKDAVIIGSAMMHYSFEKAADLLGIGSNNSIKIPVDKNNHIDLSELRKTVEECNRKRRLIIAIIANAGTTDCGAIDPIERVAEIAYKEGCHFHVDAAWGGPLLFSDKYRNRLKGIELADSVTIDGHKQLYLPMGLGMIFMRNPQAAKSIEKNSNYIIRRGSIDLGRRSLEGSRPAMSIYLHAALNIIAKGGYEFLINEGIKKAEYMAGLIKSMREFELLTEPDMNMLLYRFIPERLRDKAADHMLDDADNEVINKYNEQLQKLQRNGGYSFVSRTSFSSELYQNKSLVALRAVLANPLTCEANINEVINDQLNIAKRLNL